MPFVEDFSCFSKSHRFFLVDVLLNINPTSCLKDRPRPIFFPFPSSSACFFYHDFCYNKTMTRILDNELMGDEEYVERTLRPQKLNEYIGQDKVKDQLKIFIEAAKLRDEAWTTPCFLAPRFGEDHHGLCHCQ